MRGFEEGEKPFFKLGEPPEAQTEHDRCRIAEFSRWPRVVLEHERSNISKYLANAGAYLDKVTVDGHMHDLSDIDACLAELAVRVEVDGK